MSSRYERYINKVIIIIIYRRRTETSAIHMNLAVSEILAILFFLVAYPAVNIKVCTDTRFIIIFHLGWDGLITTSKI